jgi:phosphotransferase system enzyme I (PtsI)
MPTSAPTTEIVLKGIPAAPGIALGPLYLFRRIEQTVVERRIAPADVDAELLRLEGAIERSKKELAKILAFAEQKLGPSQAKIFEAQLLILEDVVLFESVFKRVRYERKNAEFLVHEEMEKYHRLMANARDEYTRERAMDLEEVRNRLIRNLQEQKLVSRLEGAHIIAAHQLGAADAMILSRNNVLAYVTEIGGATSHMALLARALQIPTVVGVHDLLQQVSSGAPAIVDGFRGEVVIHPTPATIESCECRKKEMTQFEQTLAELRDLPAETLDGHRVTLAANVELSEELPFIHRQGAEGIGLYRTETLLIGKEVFPTEEQQFRQYDLIAGSMAPRQVIIRTFDIGGDKLMTQQTKEQNPFLGWRGIRIMLDKPQVFLDQLRAVLRASVRKNVAIMFPMVSNIKEVRLAKQLLDQAKDELRSRGHAFDEQIPVGVMVEVPAAAIIAGDLAREVTFLSIGTNDLIQYLLAVDRGNDVVSDLYQEFHPAVVRFLRRIIERGKDGGAWVGMCGEMAGDPLATVLLLGLGLDEFSVAPTILPEIKKIIRSVRLSDAKRLADHVLSLDTEDAIRAAVADHMRKTFPEIPINLPKNDEARP